MTSNSAPKRSGTKRSEGEDTLACRYHKPFADAKTVVHFHGNGETVADYVPFFGDHNNVMALNFEPYWDAVDDLLTKICCE
ncbi:MAG: hypothetical protein GY854_17860 [Deltaproteobacteria bacterium]|nr:hypothetical protein [Deltaproteobacteria bacterium]